MIEIIKYPKTINRNCTNDNSVRQTVQTILQAVKKDGDVALMEFERKWESGARNAEVILNDELKNAIHQAKSNIEKYHRAQLQKTNKIEIQPGIECWQKSVPIERVGIYIPAGTAPLFSTVLMLAIPATIAGCREIILCTPAINGGSRKLIGEAIVEPTICWAAGLCGITKIFPIGGAQAIAAMAYGTQTIPKVDKIFGPGNQYVTIAKQLVQMEGVAIDMPAGPSEQLIIADDSAIPEFLAADLLSQAEHGPDSHVILVTTDEIIAAQTVIELNKQIQSLPRKDIAEKALRNSKLIIIDNVYQAIQLSNQYAPEHLILAIEEPELWADQVTNAGSVFLGNYSPEAAGDYATGTNHVLPTNGYARSYSGVSVQSFMKKISFQKLSKEGLENIGNTVMAMAEAEGLSAHANAIKTRLSKNYNHPSFLRAGAGT